MSPEEVRAIVREELESMAETVLLELCALLPSKKDAGITDDMPVSNQLYDKISRLLAAE